MAKKKIFAVSDIHGCYTPLIEALNAAGYDRDNEEHLLVCCGDLFDRGNENRRVYDYFDRMTRGVVLRGNHEDMLLEILFRCRMQEHNYHNGTVSTIREFFGDQVFGGFGRLDLSGKTRTVDGIFDLVGRMRDYFETEHYVFVHGWLPLRETEIGKYSVRPDWRSASPEDWEAARWLHFHEVCRRSDDRPDGKTVVCGHVPCVYASVLDPSRSGEDCSVYHGDRMIAIDGGAAFTGKVNVLVLEDEVPDGDTLRF